MWPRHEDPTTHSLPLCSREHYLNYAQNIHAMPSLWKLYWIRPNDCGILKYQSSKICTAYTWGAPHGSSNFHNPCHRPLFTYVILDLSKRFNRASSVCAPKLSTVQVQLLKLIQAETETAWKMHYWMYLFSDGNVQSNILKHKEEILWQIEVRLVIQVEHPLNLN